MMKLVGAGQDGKTIALHLEEDGERRWLELDDVEAIRPWGSARIIVCETRDPVIIRANGEVHMLVTQR